MTWGAGLRVIGLAAALLAGLWAVAVAQERAALSLVEAGSGGLVVAWTWQGDEPDAFAVHWRPRLSGAEWASAEVAGSARRYAITGLRPLSAYIVRVRPLDAEGKRIRGPDGRSLDLRGVFDTIQLPVPDAPRVASDEEQATEYGLRFSLESSRDLCTEGTLTEIRWSASGGTSPLSLWINGEPAAELDGTAKVNCGLIPRTADGEIDETQRDVVITGFLRDGRGTIRYASVRVPRAEALPAPANARFAIFLSTATLAWDTVAGAGEQSPLNADQLHIAYALRTRLVGDAEWTTEAVEARQVGEYHVHRIARSPKREWEFAVAAVRHPFEIDTPGQLNWSAPQKFRTEGKPQNLSVETSHESMTVRFDRQPQSDGGFIEVRGPHGTTSEMYLENGEEGRHAILIDDLSPDEEYQITIRIFSVATSEADWAWMDDIEARATVRTKAAPDGWTPPTRGPKNIRVTSTHNSITVRWDPPQPDQQEDWDLTLRLVSTDEHLDGLLIDTRGIPANVDTVWTTIGNALRGLIKPDTTYRLRITQEGVQDHWEEVLVTTSPAPSDAAGQNSPDVRGIPEPGELVISQMPARPLDTHLGNQC